GVENRNTYDYVFDRLAKRSGGLFETTLSSMGAESELKKLAAHLRSQYQLTYATVGDLKQRKTEVQVARPRAEVPVGPPRNPRSHEYQGPRHGFRGGGRGRGGPDPGARADAYSHPAARTGPAPHAHVRRRDRGHQPEPLRDRRPQPLRDRPQGEGLRG